MHPSIVAHRGLTEVGHIENTLDAIRAAIDAGAPAVEFDVRRSLDDRWVVHHDPDLRRIHDLPVTIAEHTLAELTSLAPISPLRDVVAAFADHPTIPMIEIKEPTISGLESLVTDLRPALSRPSVVVIARGPDMPRALAETFALLPARPKLFLYTRSWREARDRADEPLDGYDLPWDPSDESEVDPALRRFEKRGQVVAVWTVNEANDARGWLDRGARWVITDRPLALSQALEDTP
ncbi:MAG: hypothetical protein KDC38_03185 [Planctomycetes bacterium]|nr:hypothetical protein [Planctomycetota bacterium]